MAYTVTMLSKWSEGCVGSRLMLTVGGFISIGLAIGAALGLGSAFGLFYTPLMGVFPFLLIGECSTWGLIIDIPTAPAPATFVQ